MTTWVMIVIGLVLVVLAQGRWTSRDSWFVAIFAAVIMAMVIDHYFNQLRLLALG
jgi:hypothetical protein